MTANRDAANDSQLGPPTMGDHEDEARRNAAYDPGTDEHRAGRPSPPIPEGNMTCPACRAVVAWEGEMPTDCIRCGFPLDRGCRYCDEDPVGYDALGRVACAEHIEQVAEDIEAMS